MVRFPLWVSIVVILGALLILAGAVISKIDPTLLTNGSPMTEAARIYADYLFARNARAVGVFRKRKHMKTDKPTRCVRQNASLTDQSPFFLTTSIK